MPYKRTYVLYSSSEIGLVSFGISTAKIFTTNLQGRTIGAGHLYSYQSSAALLYLFRVFHLQSLLRIREVGLIGDCVSELINLSRSPSFPLHVTATRPYSGRRNHCHGSHYSERAGKSSVQSKLFSQGTGNPAGSICLRGLTWFRITMTL